MDEFNLKVFISAARHLNFTKCASEMRISQPAVSKQISDIEKKFGLPLFERNGRNLRLTYGGTVLLEHAQKILDDYSELDNALSNLTHNLRGTLKIGASTSIDQYYLPHILAKFKMKHPEVEISTINGNSVQIEQALFDKKIDLGIVENIGRANGLSYKTMAKDELVLICSTKGKYASLDSISTAKLIEMPIVLREYGSGTLEVIETHLKAKNIKLSQLNSVIRLGSTEAIKHYVIESDSVAFVSIVSVLHELQEGVLKVIDINDVEMSRVFSFVYRLNDISKLSQSFITFSYSI